MYKLSDEEHILLKVQGLHYFSSSLAGIFVGIFLFKLGGLQSTTLYMLISFLFLLIWYVASGWALKKFSSTTLLHFGLICLATHYGLLFLLQEKAISHLVLLGIIGGTGMGNFWAGFNISQYILTHQKTRSRYFGQAGSLISLAQSFAPAIGGGIIFITTYLTFPEIVGYSLLFLSVMLLIIINILLSSKLPSYSGVDFSLRHIVDHRRTRNWKLILLQQFFIGIYDVGFGTVSSILLYVILQKEFTVGVVSTIAALIYASSSFLAGSLLLKDKRFLYFGLGTSLGILIFALQQNWIGIIALILINGLAAPFLYIPPSTLFLNTVDEIDEPWQKKYHFLIERDTALGIPRILNYFFLFIFFGSGNQINLAREWIKIVPGFPVIVTILVLMMDQRIRQFCQANSLNGKRRIA